MPRIQAVGPSAAASPNRHWDYIPERGTFYDRDLGIEVNADGTPVAPPSPPVAAYEPARPDEIASTQTPSNYNPVPPIDFSMMPMMPPPQPEPTPIPVDYTPPALQTTWHNPVSDFLDKPQIDAGKTTNEGAIKGYTDTGAPIYENTAYGTEQISPLQMAGRTAEAFFAHPAVQAIGAHQPLEIAGSLGKAAKGVEEAGSIARELHAGEGGAISPGGFLRPEHFDADLKALGDQLDRMTNAGADQEQIDIVMNQIEHLQSAKENLGLARSVDPGAIYKSGLEQEISGLQDTINQHPLRQYSNLINRNGEVPEYISIEQAQTLKGSKDITAIVEGGKGDKVLLQNAVDEVAQAKGFESTQDFVRSLEELSGMQQRVRSLRQEIKTVETLPVEGVAPPAEPPVNLSSPATNNGSTVADLQAQIKDAQAAGNFADVQRLQSQLREQDVGVRSLPETLEEKTGTITEKQYYEVMHNTDTSRAVADLIEKDPAAVRALVMDATGEPSQAALHAYDQLVRIADAVGNESEIQALTDVMAARLTGAGQMIEAAKHLGGPLSPGIIRLTVRNKILEGIKKAGEPAIRKQLAELEKKAAKQERDTAKARLLKQADTEEKSGLQLAKEIKARADVLDRRPTAKRLIDEALLKWGKKPTAEEAGNKSLGAMAADKEAEFQARIATIADMPETTAAEIAAKETEQTQLLKEIIEADTKEPTPAQLARTEAQRVAREEKAAAKAVTQTERDTAKAAAAETKKAEAAATKAEKEALKAEQDSIKSASQRESAIARKTAQDARERADAASTVLRDAQRVENKAQRAITRTADQRAQRLEYLMDDAVRTSKEDLTPAENQAVNQMKAGLKKTGAEMSADQANTFLDKAEALGDLQGEAKRKAVKALVDEYNAVDPMASAIEQRLVGKHYAASAKQLAADLEYMVDKTTRTSGGAAIMSPTDRTAINKIKSLLNTAGVEVPTDLAASWIKRALAFRDLDPLIDARNANGKGFQAVTDLLNEVKAYDPVKAHLASEAAKKAESRWLRKYANDFEQMTKEAARTKRAKAANIEVQTVGSAKSELRKAGVEAGDALTKAFLDSSHKLMDMPTDTPVEKLAQERAAKTLLGDINAIIPKTTWQNIERVFEVLGLPRVLKAAYDLSFVLGRTMLAVGHPVDYANAVISGVKAFAHADIEDAVLAARKYGHMSGPQKEAGLGIVDPFGPMGAREEGFTFRGSKKLDTMLNNVKIIGGLYQVVKLGKVGADRAFTTFGNKLRGDVFNSTVRHWLPDGMKDMDFATLDDLIKATGKSKRDFTELARFVNAASGRSENAALDASAKWLSPVFWSPRYTLSTFEAPLMAVHGGGSHAVTKMAAVDMAKWLGSIMTPLALIKLAGGKVTLDPLSNDFGKGEWNGITFDYSGGVAGDVRMAAQFFTGKQRMSSGRLADADRGMTVFNWLRGKFTPPFALGADVVSGSNAIGEPVNTPSTIAQDAVKQMAPTPFTAQDAKQAWDAAGAAGVLVAGPQAFLGVREQTNSRIQDARITAAERIGKPIGDMLPSEKKALDNEPEVAKVIADLETRVGQPMEQQYRYASNTYRTSVADMEAEVKDKLVFKPTGEALRKIVQDFNNNKYNLGKRLFTPEIDAYAKRGVTQEDKDRYRDAWQGVDAPLTDGLNPDFKARDEARSQILKEAVDAGVDPKYVTEWVNPAKDPEVAKALEDYHKAQETLKPFWEVQDQVEAEWPAYAEAKKSYDALPPGDSRKADYAYLKNQFDPMVEDRRDALRLQNDGHNPIEEALMKWYPRVPIMQKVEDEGPGPKPIKPRMPVQPRRPVGAR